MLVLCGGLVACGSGPAVRYYVLASPASHGAGNPGPPSELPPVSTALTVGVEPLRVDPPYDQDRLVYRVGEASAEVGFYAYHRWASSLGRDVALVAVEELHGLPGVARIEPAAPGKAYPLTLTGRLAYLEEVDLPGSVQVRVRLDLELVSADGTRVWSQSVSTQVSGQSPTVGEVVELMRRALREALANARAGMSGALEERLSGAETPG